MNAGAQFGLVLPTGVTDVANAEGVVAERSLQPGTGATSGVAGLYANYGAQDGCKPWSGLRTRWRFVLNPLRG